MKPLKDTVSEYWEREGLPTLIEFGKIPNVSPAFDKEWKKNGHMDRAVEFLADWVKRKNIADTVIIQQAHDRTPLLYIEIKGTRDETILIYGHFDKQPELSGWREGLGPWNPVREGDYLYGRGLADDGYAVFAAIGAIEIAKKSGAELPRIVLLIEGSEESASGDLPVYLELLKDEIGNPNVIITLDAEGGDVNHLWLTNSLRGIVNGVLTIKTLDTPMHSGAATGIVPSAFRIARILLNRIEDSETGLISHPEINPPIPKEVRERFVAIANAVGDTFLDMYNLPSYLKTVAPGLTQSIERNLFHAGLEVTGFDGLPPVERAGNVTAATLKLKLSLRIPPTVDCQVVAQTLKELLETNPPYGARVTYEALEMDNGWLAKPLSPNTEKAVIEAAQVVYQDTPIKTGVGAGIPFIGMMARTYPNADQLVTGILSPSSNAHGPNENLHIPTVKNITEWVAHFLINR
ncbi:MAG: M20/M25/M40 family metallo-hydrolase [Patescibacteria group bacterium]